LKLQCKKRRKMKNPNQELRRKKRKMLQRKRLKRIKSNLKPKKKRQEDKQPKLNAKQKKKDSFLLNERQISTPTLSSESMVGNFFNLTWKKSKQNPNTIPGPFPSFSKTSKSSPKKT